MKIILANPRGFCAGVNMAIESLERALELFGTPLYVYHEIVHNRPVVERFRKRGVVFVDDIDEIPAGRDGPLQRPRRRAGHPRRRRRAQPARHRRHLPARHQGPPRSGPLRPRGLHHHPDRPRGARRGDRHDGRGPGAHSSGAERRGRRSARSAGRREGRLPDADDAERGRRRGHHRRAASGASRTSSARRRTTSATPRRTARRPSRSWCPRPTS